MIRDLEFVINCFFKAINRANVINNSRDITGKNYKILTFFTFIHLSDLQFIKRCHPLTFTHFTSQKEIFALKDKNEKIFKTLKI